jgi:hypothetical protein
MSWAAAIIQTGVCSTGDRSTGLANGSELVTWTICSPENQAGFIACPPARAGGWRRDLPRSRWAVNQQMAPGSWLRLPKLTALGAVIQYCAGPTGGLGTRHPLSCAFGYPTPRPVRCSASLPWALSRRVSSLFRLKRHQKMVGRQR